ncbi:MAG: helix-turn-helix domain-containing protein [Gemmatimonadota bacterium]|jgi:excisionase family DNA binding protein
MERFNPELTLTSSETADLLEVHPSTVKRWCNEGDLPSGKTPGGHRRIHLEDAVEFARARGIHTVLSPFHPYEPHVWTALKEVRDEGSFRRFRSLAMGWITRGSIRRVTHLYDALARDASIPFSAFCDQAVRGLMEQVGEAWSQGRLRVGEEHLISQAMTEVLLKVRAESDGYRTGRIEDDRPVAVVGTLEGNHHHLGSMCIRVLLERMGWEVFYLGPDVPVEDFGVIQRGRSASLVCISLTPPAAAGDVARAVQLLEGLYDPGQPYALAFGGRVQDGVAPELLAGPFTDVGVFGGCEEFRAEVEAGFGARMEVVA